MIDVHYRHWQPGDDEGVMRILGPMGWCTAEHYAAKFEDRGLRPEDVLIAEADGTIVGHLMLPHRRLRFGQATLPFGGVGMVVVDPAARGHGIGARLLDAAVARHQAAGNALSGLFTKPSLLPAYEMYGRRGYVTVAERSVLHLLPAALGTPPTDLQARPATEHDCAAVTRLLDHWAAEHSGVSVEAAGEPLANQRLVTRGGAVVGRLEIGERPDGRYVHRLLADPDVSVAAVLAAGAAGQGVTGLRVITNPGSRAYAELAPLATREEQDGGQLMLAPLGLARVLAGLVVEIAGRLRQAGAAPVEATLALAETGERVHLAWQGTVLTVDDPPAGEGAPVSITRAVLARGLMGQPAPPPSPALAPLWTALFPATRIEMRLVNCW